MSLLEEELVIDLTTVARVNVMLGNQDKTNGLIADEDLIRGLIRMCSHDAQMRLMQRAVQKKSRTERFDIAQGQRDFWVLASPIAIPTDVDTDITIYYNTDQPRAFTASADEVSASYIICNPEMRSEGRIHVEKDYDACVDALQITYTGGMASSTAITGTNGSSAASTTFTSTGVNFTTLGVNAGDTLAITESGNDDHGLHKIATVGTTTLTLVTALTTTASNLDYEIIDGDNGQDTIVGKYPDIAEAMDIQIRYMLQNRGKFGIAQEQVAGTMLMSHRPVNWLLYPEAVLMAHAKRI